MNTYGNLAIKPAYQPEESRVFSQNKTRISKKQTSTGMLTAVVYMAIIFLVAFLLISREVSIYEKNSQISALQNELEVLQSQTKQAMVAAEEAIDLNYVEEIAYSKYGMIKPEKSQTVYINIKADDYVAQVCEQNIIAKTATQVKNSVTNLFGIFSAR